ncbi:oligosaccharide flippase family protein [Rhodovastum atsumiense]|uniref:Oligosaccharide flippase family protein n=1 Tax=Rhodovastum atsumiense TaxID=504468 RepID=A0A5M6IW52_9PROT|nr:oligosaccharide flippase family protein [Rhodovastum atsumiense]KAA5612563.1 oligosaccharide flippase family protein [Rhodovastum atsumiense]
MQLRRALLISTADRYVGMVVNFAQLAIIARLMTPDEFGVAVIGTAITSIAIAVREFASQVYLINRPRLSLTTIRACFTLMMLTTLLIVAVILAMAPWMEAWYDRPGLALYLGLIGVALLLEPFSQMIVGLLRRDLAFGKVAVVNIVNVVVNAAMLVVLVGHGVGFTAFGWAWVACALASVLVAIALRPDLSVFRPSLRGLRDAVRFGAYNGAAALLYRVYEAGPLFALGQMLSFNELGLFYRTLTLAQLPDKVVLSGVTAVALPAFSQAAREGRDLTTAYLRAVTLITAVQWPALACMATMAEGVVHVVLGDTWMAVAPLLRIMAVASLFAFTSELNYPVLVATGAMRQNLRRALIAWPGSAAIIMGFAVFGLHAVVLSFLVVIPFQALVSVLAVRHSLSLSTRKLFGAVGRSAVVTGITVLGPLTVMALQPTHTVMSPWALFVSLLLAMLAWLAALRLTRHPAWQEILRLLPARAPAGGLVAVAGARD